MNIINPKTTFYYLRRTSVYKDRKFNATSFEKYMTPQDENNPPSKSAYILFHVLKFKL